MATQPPPPYPGTRTKTKNDSSDCQEMCILLIAVVVLITIYVTFGHFNIAFARLGQHDVAISHLTKQYASLYTKRPDDSKSPDPLAGLSKSDLDMLASKKRLIRNILKALKDTDTVKCKTEGDSVKCY